MFQQHLQSAMTHLPLNPIHLEEYKHDNGDLCDYTDTILRARFCEPPDNLEVAYFDEVQDYSLAMLEAAYRMAENAKVVVFALDDDQSIHSWAGNAANRTLVGLEGERHLLEKSYRIGPGAAFELSERIIGFVHNRVHKNRLPADDHETALVTHCLRDQLRDAVAEGEWLLLGRTKYQLSSLHKMLYERGHLFERLGVSRSTEIQQENLRHSLRAIVGWEVLRKGAKCDGSVIGLIRKYVFGGGKDGGISAEFVKDSEYGMAHLFARGMNKEIAHLGWYDALANLPSNRDYLKRCEAREGLNAFRKACENEDDGPRIKIGTIHSAKGMEADNVFVAPGWTSSISNAYYQLGLHDAEHRIWYVGVTRARRKLYLGIKGIRGYNFPV